VAVSFFGLIVLGAVLITTRAGNSEFKIAGSDKLSKQDVGYGETHEHPVPDSARAQLLNSLAAPKLIPASGPARLAKSASGMWTIEGDKLIRKDLGSGAVMFGDIGWSDYDLSLEASKSSGPGGFGVSVRAGGGRQVWLRIADENKHKLGTARSGKRSELRSSPGTIRPGDWYNVKISLRGSRIRVELDGHLLFSYTGEHSQRGAVGLRFIDSTGSFRNIKVTAPDGAILWEGPPDLPKE